MATYATTKLDTTAIGMVVASTENGAGVRVINSATTITYVLADGGNTIIQTIDVPVIHRTFDTGFQVS